MYISYAANFYSENKNQKFCDIMGTVGDTACGSPFEIASAATVKKI